MPTEIQNTEKDYAELLGLLMAMVNAQANHPIPVGQAWQNDRQTLAKKMAYHLLTIQSIREGSTLRVGDEASPFVDHGSITVLARAVLENFIVFAHVFGCPDMETCRFLHMTWKFGGLMDRQKRLPITDVGRLTLASERPQVDQLLKSIKEHELYMAFPNGKQKAMVKGDWSGGRKWHELAVDVGFNERYFKNIYSYLCDYSHTSYAAALQVGQADTLEAQASMSSSMLGILVYSMARFISIYAELFDSAKEILSQSPANSVAKKWNFTAGNFDEIYRQH